ncbi:hypothetical protein TruAng_001320 [Truncatella angustata]|nr:hypothetical protein TruAng_001320 [Truncatella angustata]
MALNRITGDEDLYVGGIFALRKPELLEEKNITSVLSVIKYSFEGWGDKAKRFKHISIDVDDMDDEDLLVHFPSAVRFIERGLHPSQVPTDTSGDQATDHADQNPLPTSEAVFVHCAMGKSRSVSCVMAYLLYKYPHRYGGKQFAASAASTGQRRESAPDAVAQALKWVQESRPIAEPNPGFMRQLELWWEMGCPADSDSAVDNHPIYQRWLYENKLREARDAGMAPEADWIRFEDEAEPPEDQPKPNVPKKQLRCKKCRRELANSQFIVEHHGTDKTGDAAAPCPHIFVETLSWMRPYLEDGSLDGRLLCPNTKCNAIVGRFAWQGLKSSMNQDVADVGPARMSHNPATYNVP